MSIGQFMPSPFSGAGFEPDPFEKFVAMDLRMDEVVGTGPTQTTSPLDSSPFNSTFISGGRMNLVKSPAKLGKSAGSFSGTGDQVQCQATVLRWWPDDLTWEFWLYIPSRKGSDACVFDMRTVTDNYEPYLVLNTSGVLSLSIQNNWRMATPALSLNTWHHISVGRLGGAWSLYANGVRVNATYSNTTEFGQGRLTLGTYMDQWGSGAAYHFLGCIDNVRLWKGVSVRGGAASFTPPKRPYKPLQTSSIIVGSQEVTTALSSSLVWGYYSSFFDPPRGTSSGQVFDGFNLDYVQGNNTSFFVYGVTVGIRNASMADYLQILGRGSTAITLTKGSTSLRLTTLNYNRINKILEWSISATSTTIGAALFGDGGAITVSAS